MAPPIAASPITWMLGTQLRFERRRDRSDTSRCGRPRRPASAMWPALLRRDDVGDIGLVRVEVGLEACWSPASTDVTCRRPTAGPIRASRDRISSRPSSNNRCLEKASLASSNDHFGTRLFGLEVVGDQAGALIRALAGNDRALAGAASTTTPPSVHRLELPSQQQWSARLPSRHVACGPRRPRHSPAAHRTARSMPGAQHQPVIGSVRAVREGDGAACGIDPGGGLRHHAHASGGDGS